MAAASLSSLNGQHQFRFHALGTSNTVLFRAAAPALARQFHETVLRWLAEFEGRYSRFIPDSLVSRINAAAGRAWVESDPETEELLALCDWFHWKTGGIFDPTAGPLVRLWDYHAPQPALPTPETIAHERRLVGWSKLERAAGRVRLAEAGMSLDLGGIGKEYAVDRVFEMARRLGILNLLVDFGRDLRAGGQPPEGGDWRIGLEHPGQPDSCWAGVALKETALCCSGDYQRFVEIGGRRYSHLLDPRSGQPVHNGVRAVWALAPTCTEAGILTTTACILGVEEGLRLFEQTPFAAGCIWSEQGLFQTRRFQHVLSQEQRSA
ncbi:MAG: FAD:protein FMN transferase [Kiritimatiellaeota bacterium]|nr:FAD:protein FMN transferase [Kiritimatiellota bacterium]